MHLQESGEMYLETIHLLTQKMGVVRSIDICEHMGYSKPSVSRAMGLLREGGYIVVEKGGHIVLTDAGKEIAEKIYNRHTLLSKFLTSIG
ncbi:MAG: metal-dependent transcriptional regulator, partial [Oscillospiraceae bacterium]|nr:metal-dependent transcriptional regulator [Oscillospiraceae bacterium]